MSPVSVFEPLGGRGGGINLQVAPGIGIGEKAELTEHASTAAKPNGEYSAAVTSSHTQANESGDTPRAIYSPLTNLSNEPQFATVRRGHKVMVGHNGWLERPETLDRKPAPLKKARFLDTLKRMAKDVVSCEMQDNTSAPTW